MRPIKPITLLLACILCSISSSVFATHIVGADLTYKCLNASSNLYQVTLTVYRDCLNGQAGFDSPVYIYAFQSNSGNLYTELTVSAPFNTPQIPPENLTACSSNPPALCVEYATYTANITLPPIPGGYDLAWARCCRNNTVTNIGAQQGITVLAHVPGSEVPGCNSMPTFNQLAPLFLCVNQPFSFDHSATDVDGDSLVYVISNPYTGTNLVGFGADLNNPVVSPANPMGTPPYANVNYLPGFTYLDPFGSGNFSIDPNSGLLTLIPTQVGLSVFAISVLEYRNGVLLSENKRDFQINVIQCNPPGNPPNISPNLTSVPSSNDTVFVEPFESFCYDVNISPGDPGDTLDAFPVSASFGIGGTAPPPFASLNVVGINTLTGQVCWQPACSYAGDTVSLIIGANATDECPGYNVIFDTVYVVVEDFFAPEIAHIFGGNSSIDTINATVGQNFCYSVQATDANAGDDLSLFVVDGPFAGSGATPPFANITTSGTGNSIAGTICWQPSCQYADQYVDFIIGVKDTNGCNSSRIAYDTMTVFVQDLLPIFAGADSSICSGTSIQLNATGGIGSTFAWTPSTNLSNSSSPNPIASPTLPTQYIASVSYFGGCLETDTINIGINPLPSVNAGTDVTICLGDDVLLQPTSATAVSYDWFPATGLSNPNIANPTASPPASTLYSLTVTDANGCEAQDFVSVNLEPIPNYDAGANQVKCGDASVQLNAVGGDVYVWTPAASLSDPNISDPIATPTNTTMYYVQITDAIGCTYNDSLQVRTMYADAGPDFTICEGDTVQLTAAGGIGYGWTNGADLSNPNISSPLAFPTTTTEFEVTVTDPSGCDDKDTAVITVNLIPFLEAGNDTVKCGEDAIALDAQGVGSFSWSPAAGLSNANIANPIATPSSSTTYFINLIDANGCENRDTLFIRTMYANAGQEQTICFGDIAQLTASGGATYSWNNPTSLSDPSINTPLASPSDSTVYIVTVTDVSGCTDTDTVRLNVNQLPNVDAGNNTAICLGDNISLNATGANTYTWSPITALNNPNIASPTASPTDSILYFVTGIDANGCVNEDSILIAVNAIPFLEAGNDTAKCGNIGVQLSAQGNNLSYTWTPTTGLNDPNAANPIANPSATTTYYVTGLSPTGCSNKDTIEVRVMYADAGNDQVICIGEAAQLQASGGVSFSWDDPTNSLSQTDISNPNASPSNSLSYTVTVTDITGCTDTDEVQVQVNPLPIADAGADQEICFGESANLAASGGIIYQWNPAADLSNASSANPSANPTSTTTYSVLVEDANGCENTDDMTLTVHPLPNVQANNDTLICREGVAQLAATGATTYEWSPAGSLDDANIAQPLASPYNTRTYTVTGTDDNGCENQDEVTVRVQPLPVAQGRSLVDICLGKSAVLSMIGGQMYEWSTGESGASITVTPIDTSQYWVIPIEGDCIGDTFHIQVNVVQDLPVAAFVPDTTEGFFPLEVSFTNQSLFSSNYVWLFGDDKRSIATNPTHSYELPGEYTVTLVADNDVGCPDEVTYSFIDVWDFTFFVPNAFTPNGDGYNDEFFIVPLAIEQLSIQIFDRWGNVVFSSDEVNFRWNGLSMKGTPVPEGVYAYRVKVQTRGRTAERAATITVIR